MHIAIFLPSLHGGGAEKAMVNLASDFCKRGFKVDLVVANCEGPYLSQVPENVNVVDLGVGRILSSLQGLVHYLNRAQPSALLSAMDHANVVALWARRLSRVQTRLVISVQNMLSISTTHSGVRGRLIYQFARRCYRWADAVVAVSRGVADDLSQIIDLPRERIRVIYNPVVVPELFDLAKEPVDHAWFRVCEPPVVLSVGRLTAQKDYSTLLRAFAIVTRDSNVRLVILGEGEERSKLEAMVRELGLESCVSMPGFVNNPFAYMSKSAVFVLSSAWEGFGNVLVEAMACGMPVVSTDCPSGPSEILENGKYGRLVPVANVGALADGIIATIDDSSNADELRRRAEAFSCYDIANQYLELVCEGELASSSK